MYAGRGEPNATLTCKHRCGTAGERDNKYPGLYVRNGTTWGVVGREKADEKANEAQTMNDNNLTGKPLSHSHTMATEISRQIASC